MFGRLVGLARSAAWQLKSERHTKYIVTFGKTSVDCAREGGTSMSPCANEITRAVQKLTTYAVPCKVLGGCRLGCQTELIDHVDTPTRKPWSQKFARPWMAVM